MCYSRVIPSPAKNVWEFFNDFSGLKNFVDIGCVISNGKAENEIGAIRSVFTPAYLLRLLSSPFRGKYTHQQADKEVSALVTKLL